MCLVKVRGEVEDDVIVPARVVERESVHTHQRETQIVETAPAVIERPSRSRRYSSSSSSASSRSSIRSSQSSNSYGGRHRSRRSYQGGSSYDGRSGSRERSYYREHDRVSSGGGHERGVRSSYRYVDPQPRGSAQEVRAEIMRAEEHLQRAAELQERERRHRDVRAITYDPRSSEASHRSRDGSRHRGGVVVVQETERHRDRFAR
ncbi:hypothetical protein H072_3316 [Dactylellina haptotyla CBS 200.50]|uniref:Uncharacterized protein n=1 Tax=Dactylellina haptotyla (strain CBS 200.50) TaxID=1284197 RepID=S8C4N8_DACHA|nr:hypothetical protein H072_3316 [Dactylellina haptotyla CBS 200.50]